MAREREELARPSPNTREKNHAERNLAEVIVRGSGKAESILNGKLPKAIHDMKFKDASGKGPFFLQAEWAELQYRTVRVRKLDD